MKSKLLSPIAGLLAFSACAPELPTEDEVMSRLKAGGEACIREIEAVSDEPDWVRMFVDEYGDNLLAMAPEAATQASEDEIPTVYFRPREGVQLIYHETAGYRRTFAFRLVYKEHVYESKRLGIFEPSVDDSFSLDGTWQLRFFEDRTTRNIDFPGWVPGGVHCSSPTGTFMRIREFSYGDDPDADVLTLDMANGEQWAAYGREKNKNTGDAWTEENTDGLAGEVCHNTVCRGLTTIEPERAMPDVAWEPPVPKFFRDYRALVLELASINAP